MTATAETGSTTRLIAVLMVAGFIANAARIAIRQRRLGSTVAVAGGWFLMLGKVPECIGLARYHMNRARGRRTGLIEYKGAGS